MLLSHLNNSVIYFAFFFDLRKQKSVQSKMKSMNYIIPQKHELFLGEK